jgi:hypothetical protein
MTRWLAVCIVGMGLGCKPGEGKTEADDTGGGGDGGGGDGGGGDGGGGDGGGGGGGDGMSPVISAVDAWCYTPGGSVEGDWWGINATVEDPQGPADLASFQPTAVQVYDPAGTPIKTMALVCDGTAVCFGSDSVANLGIACAQADQFQFEFTVEDSSGNRSAPSTTAGRQGTDASG